MEEDWDKVKAYVLVDASIGKFKSCATISGTEDRVYNIFGMTKPMSLQMVKAPQALARLFPTKAEALTSLWLTMCKAMERLTLATPSVAELQAAAGNEANSWCTPAETTVLSTTVPVVGLMPPPWHCELKDDAITAL